MATNPAVFCLMWRQGWGACQVASSGMHSNFIQGVWVMMTHVMQPGSRAKQETTDEIWLAGEAKDKG